MIPGKSSIARGDEEEDQCFVPQYDYRPGVTDEYGMAVGFKASYFCRVVPDVVDVVGNVVIKCGGGGGAVVVDKVIVVVVAVG